MRTHAGAWAAGLVGVGLLLAGCAATAEGGTTAATSAAASRSSAEAGRYASNTPPAAAQMICSEEIRGEVADAVGLPSIPAPQPVWADHVLTCTYPLPMGRLVLSVAVAPGDAEAGQQLEAARTQLGSTQEEPGLGSRAYSAATGTVIAVKDDMVLRVDASGLPDDLGATHESRTELARTVAAGVFNCWTGNS